MIARRRRSLRLLALPLALSIAACATPRAERPSSDAGRDAPLRAADLAMARAVAAQDVAAFALHVDEEAVWGGSKALLHGRDAVVARWTAFMTPGGPQLSWAPTEGALSQAGDLGYTAGTYLWKGKGPDGSPKTAEGRYLTVWRRGTDGGFRALFDMERAPPPASAPPPRTVVRRVESARGDLRAEVGTWQDVDGARGTFLVVLRREPDGAFVPVADAQVPFTR